MTAIDGSQFTGCSGIRQMDTGDFANGQGVVCILFMSAIGTESRWARESHLWLQMAECNHKKSGDLFGRQMLKCVVSTLKTQERSMILLPLPRQQSHAQGQQASRGRLRNEDDSKTSAFHLGKRQGQVAVQRTQIAIVAIP